MRVGVGDDAEGERGDQLEVAADDGNRREDDDVSGGGAVQIDAKDVHSLSYMRDLGFLRLAASLIIFKMLTVFIPYFLHQT